MGVLVRTFGSAVFGVNAATITIEVNVDKGAAMSIVGLPDAAVKEAQQRIRAALVNAGFTLPIRGITINMAPADVRKEGSAYDLPLALGILGATDQIPAEQLSSYVVMGELSLDGSVRPIKGVLPIALQAKKEGLKGMFIPRQNAREAAIVSDLEIYGVEHLSEVVDFLTGRARPMRTIVN
ncbi:MAG: ATP-binding protein, partial [Flavobacteriales bacterium]|nr:ATP-binding protein [Flavobacteriales bacterium]